MRLSSGTDYSVWVKYFLVAFLLLGVDSLGWFGGVHALGDKMLNPLSGISRRVIVSIGSPIDMVRFSYNGPKRITDLERRLSEALVASQELDNIKIENDSLRKLLGNNPHKDLKYVPAYVVGGMDELVISLGKADGVKPGTTVVSNEHVLLGRVVRVSTFTSWTQTVDHDQMTIPVIVGRRNISGMLVRDGDLGKLEIEQADRVQVGDMVVTSGVGGEYVPEILVGTVTEVDDESAQIYKNVWVDILGNSSEVVYLIEEDK